MQALQKISIFTSLICFIVATCEIALTYIYHDKISSCRLDKISLYTWLIINGFTIACICIYDVFCRLCCQHNLTFFRAILNIIILFNIAWIGFGMYLYLGKCNSTRIQDISYIALYTIYLIKLTMTLFIPFPSYETHYNNKYHIHHGRHYGSSY